MGAVVGGEASITIAERRQFRRNHARAACWRRRGRLICVAPLRAPRKCHRVLRGIHWQNSLARQSSRFLPSPAAFFALVRRRRSDSYLASDHDGGVALSPPAL